MNTITQSLTRRIIVEHFHSVNEQAQVYARFETTELSLRDVLHELQGVLDGAALITLREVTVRERDSRLTAGMSDTTLLTCEELGIASLPLDRILNPTFEMSCCTRCSYQADSEVCCRTFTHSELDSISTLLGLIVAAILKLTFYS